MSLSSQLALQCWRKLLPTKTSSTFAQAAKHPFTFEQAASLETSVCYKRIHTVESDVCRSEEDAAVTVQLASLWAHVVEGHLLNSSHERKAVALQLFTMLLPHIYASSVPVMLSKAFVGLLGVSLKDSGSYLHKAAARCVDRIVEWAQNSKAAESAGMLSSTVHLCVFLV